MKIICFPILVKDQNRIGLRSEKFDKLCNEKIRKIGNARWSNKDRCWYIPKDTEHWNRCKALLKKHEFVIVKGDGNESKKEILSEELQLCWDKMYTLLMVKRYSLNTVKNYSFCFHYFLRVCKTKHPDKWELEDLKKWLRKELELNKWSESYQNSMVNVIKFYF